MKKLHGTITICRTKGGGQADRISIVVENPNSSMRLVEVEISLESFAEAITGLGSRKCKIEFNDHPNALKTREHKTEAVFVPKLTYDSVKDAKTIREAVSKYEVDGWKGRDEDAHNHHNRIKGGPDDGALFTVVYQRWV